MALNGAFPQAAKSPPTVLCAGRKLKTSSSHTFLSPESQFAPAALQKALVQPYLMHLQVMEAKVDFGSGLGI